jgi:hypothetical protein
MGMKLESWGPLALSLGYEDEISMLKDMYCIQNFSLTQIAKLLGYSVFSVRGRLVAYGIPRRGKGGPNNRKGKRKLKNLTDKQLTESPTVLAKRHQVHISTVFAEIRLRAKEKRDEILSNHASERLQQIFGSE